MYKQRAKGLRKKQLALTEGFVVLFFFFNNALEDKCLRKAKPLKDLFITTCKERINHLW